MASEPNIDRVTYWKKQIRRTTILLGIWFVVAYLMSIFLADPLNSISLGGIPFGFWMAQQGSIIIFVLLVLIYAITTGRLDREAGVEETQDMQQPPGPSH